MQQAHPGGIVTSLYMRIGVSVYQPNALECLEIHPICQFFVNFSAARCFEESQSSIVASMVMVLTFPVRGEVLFTLIIFCTLLEFDVGKVV